MGTTFSNKASLQYVLSIDTTLAITPFLLLHYTPPSALIASALIWKICYQIEKNIVDRAQKAAVNVVQLCKRKLLVQRHNLLSTQHPKHSIQKSCMEYPCCVHIPYPSPQIPPTLIFIWTHSGPKLTLLTLNFHQHFFYPIPIAALTLLLHQGRKTRGKKKKKYLSHLFSLISVLPFKETGFSKPFLDTLNHIGMILNIKWCTYRFTVKVSQQKLTFQLKAPLARTHIAPCMLSLHCLMRSLCMHRTPL